MSERDAKFAPRPRALKTTEQLLDDLNDTLKKEFCLDPLSAYTILVEGWSDVKYMLRAAELARERGVDLLFAPTPDDAPPSRISVVTPGKPGAPSRGGVDQLVRLAEAIRPAVFSYEAYLGVAFIFDHDTAGIGGCQGVTKNGFKSDRHAITLDPRRHPGACARKQVVIEDLLSLRIQKAFFEQGSAWCSATYEAGTLTRYVWDQRSKAPLQDFVLANAQLEDLAEVARLLLRVRRMWGLLTDESALNITS